MVNIESSWIREVLEMYLLAHNERTVNLFKLTFSTIILLRENI